ncbi:MAG: FAD-dependent oxidoreductase, partial [Lachnospiraceae bacterium]|nr:FAD-dependent oxidoreductase [Lachnospiraceae bacterium]
PELFWVITADVALAKGQVAEEKYLKINGVSKAPLPYVFPYEGLDNRGSRPVIIGAGPAGMMCAYHLAKAGLKPLLIERGKSVRERSKDVNTFWEKGVLLPESNVQFGEGGAGCFSDGKLNTLIKDKGGRCRSILGLYVDMGAPEDILYDHKPHIGSDKLAVMTENLRNETIRLGGEVMFETLMTRVETEGIAEDDHAKPETGEKSKLRIKGIWVREASSPDEKERFIETERLVLATGHSARDTFRMLDKTGIEMEAKAFAVGYRVVHPQSLIDKSQYGFQSPADLKKLGPSPYKLSASADDKRGVYTFCMCPGGYVVNASSNPGMLAINGMSYSGRGSGFANSAVIVTVTPDDFPGKDEDPLSGVAFQEEIERKAFELAGGVIPIQYYGDFTADLPSGEYEKDTRGELPLKGRWSFADVKSILPKELNRAFVQGMEQFGKKIEGFDSPDTLVCGVESRTSSPVRIKRDESGQSRIRGIYPCGEGAGYAGGIMSAALDGLLMAEKIAGCYDREE